MFHPRNESGVHTARILGINLSHFASAAVVIDGELKAAVGEERLNRVKNWAGFPKLAIAEVLHLAGLSGDQVDLVAIGTKCELFDPLQAQFKEYRLSARLVSMLSHVAPARLLGAPLLKRLYVALIGSWRARYYRQQYEPFFADLGIPWSKVKVYEHHDCHAAAAHYLKPWPGESLIFTNDGLGDGLCATVAKGYAHRIERKVEITAIHSLGGVYSRVTRFLGLKPWHDEYKVMGLAPYADARQARPVVDFFRALFKTNELTFSFQRNCLGDAFVDYLHQQLQNVRFDHVALGVQTVLEETVQRWIFANIKALGGQKITIAGGVGLNVKANKIIAELDDVADIFIFPAAGDDSISIGAALLGDHEMCARAGQLFQPKPLQDMYLGTDAGDDLPSTVAALDPTHYQIEKPDDLARVIAGMLAEGAIVARCVGRMEYGPRALGNRSILANPQKMENINIINRAIKNRDFWMPFAPVMLDTQADRYLVNPKRIKAPYMIMAFDTRPDARREIQAAIHQADFTARPQILERASNPDFYDLLTAFHHQTGIGALLNTSFNLHGHPIVRTSQDAVDVLERSGLIHLQLGPYLISKRGNFSSQSQSQS